MRQFYITFPKRDSLRLELSWIHYRSLIRVKNSHAREWYAAEAAMQHWSARALERQIGVLYYERLLASKEKQPVEQEAQEHVVSSMTSGDILLSPTSKRGAQSLRAFLEYCETGHLQNTLHTGRPPDSDFEVAVMHALEEYGYECEPQLGVAGHYLDLAVRDHGKQGRFLWALSAMEQRRNDLGIPEFDRQIWDDWGKRI